MERREAKFNTIFNHWLKANPITGAFELKQTTMDALPYTNLATHQEQSLLNVSRGTLVYKIPDLGMQNPFDCFCLNRQQAFVVILYQKSKTFYMIPIGNFIFYRDNRAKRKSLTEKEAKEIATISVKL
jgi:penicillin-binding protein-related factor A (putative recombinase)